jgi:hypothetical protein
VKTSGAALAPASAVTGGFICCKLWLGCSIEADSISTSAHTSLMAQLTGLEFIRAVATFARPSNSEAAAHMILRNRPTAKPANSATALPRPETPHTAAPLTAWRPVGSWRRATARLRDGETAIRLAEAETPDLASPTQQRASAAKTAGAGRAPARTVTGGFVCCKLWLEIIAHRSAARHYLYGRNRAPHDVASLTLAPISTPCLVNPTLSVLTNLHDFTLASARMNRHRVYLVNPHYDPTLTRYSALLVCHNEFQVVV